MSGGAPPGGVQGAEAWVRIQDVAVQLQADLMQSRAPAAAFGTTTEHARNRTTASGTASSQGKWSEEEHAQFLLGLRLYGKNWRQVSTLVPKRTLTQIRTHAQKFFRKMRRLQAALQKASEEQATGVVGVQHRTDSDLAAYQAAQPSQQDVLQYVSGGNTAVPVVPGAPPLPGAAPETAQPVPPVPVAPQLPHYQAPTGLPHASGVDCAGLPFPRAIDAGGAPHGAGSGFDAAAARVAQSPGTRYYNELMHGPMELGGTGLSGAAGCGTPADTPAGSAPGSAPEVPSAEGGDKLQVDLSGATSATTAASVTHTSAKLPTGDTPPAVPANAHESLLAERTLASLRTPPAPPGYAPPNAQAGPAGLQQRRSRSDADIRVARSEANAGSGTSAPAAGIFQSAPARIPKRAYAGMQQPSGEGDTGARVQSFNPAPHARQKRDIVNEDHLSNLLRGASVEDTAPHEIATGPGTVADAGVVGAEVASAAARADLAPQPSPPCVREMSDRQFSQVSRIFSNVSAMSDEDFDLLLSDARRLSGKFSDVGDRSASAGAGAGAGGDEADTNSAPAAVLSDSALDFVKELDGLNFSFTDAFGLGSADADADRSCANDMNESHRPSATAPEAVAPTGLAESAGSSSPSSMEAAVPSPADTAREPSLLHVALEKRKQDDLKVPLLLDTLASDELTTKFAHWLKAQSQSWLKVLLYCIDYNKWRNVTSLLVVPGSGAAFGRPESSAERAEVARELQHYIADAYFRDAASCSLVHWLRPAERSLAIQLALNPAQRDDGVRVPHVYDQVYSVAVRLMERRYHDTFLRSEECDFSSGRRGLTLAGAVSVVEVPIGSSQCCALLSIDEIDKLECTESHRVAIAHAQTL